VFEYTVLELPALRRCFKDYYVLLIMFCCDLFSLLSNLQFLANRAVSCATETK